MERSLSDLAEFYRGKYGSDNLSADNLREVYDRYARRDQQSVVDAASATVAMNALFLEDRVNIDAINPQMLEAFQLAFPNMTIDQLGGYDPSALPGIANAWKGKYFEVELRDRLNRGEWVGEIHLGPGQKVELASDLSQPGWDLQILNADGSVDAILQAKATESISYIRKALEKYPEIEIVATEEAAREWTDQIINSQISDEELEKTIMAPMEELQDSAIEEVAEMISPLLPVIVIAASEGRRVMIGRQTLQDALNNSLDRAVRNAASIGVGGIVALVDAGVISIPATLMTHIVFDRAIIQQRIITILEINISILRRLEIHS